MKKSDVKLLDIYGAQAADIVAKEKTSFEEASREMRETLRKVFRNYTSQFDQKKTKYTKREKVFIPLTELSVNHISNKTQVEVDAITLTPTTESSMGQTKVMEPWLKAKLNSINFPELMDDITHYKDLFGTVVTVQDWEYEKEIAYSEVSKKDLDLADEGESKTASKVTKTEKVKKDCFRVKIFPLLDIYVDPTAESLQDKAKPVILRTVNTLEDVKKNKLYSNTEDLVAMTEIGDTYNSTSLNRYITGQQTVPISDVEQVELFHRYGPIKLSWVTGDENDTEMVEGIITVAQGSQSMKTIAIRLSPFKHGNRPFEEDWYEKVPGRWYGRGVGEKLIHLQRALNENFNRRIDNAEVLQNKMFKVRRGANVDPRDLISRAGGSIKVDDIKNDIEELQHSDISQSSYKDEEVINEVAQKLLGMFDIAFGGGTPDSATEAAIQNRNSGTTFAAVKRRTQNYIARLITRQLIPLMVQFIDQDEVPVEGHAEDFAEMDQMNGVDMEMAKELGGYRFFKITDTKPFDVAYDVKVEIDESGMSNKAIRIQQLKETIAMVASTPPRPDGTPTIKVDIDELVQGLLSLQGFDSPRFKYKEQLPMQNGIPQIPQAIPETGIGNPEIQINQEPNVQSGLPATPIA